MTDIKRRIEIEAITHAAQDAIGKLADELAAMTRAGDEGGDALKRATRATADATAKMNAAREAAQKEARALAEAAAAATAHGKDSKEAAAAVARLKSAQDAAAKAHNEAAQAATKAANEISELAKTADKKAAVGLKRLSDQLVKVSKDADRNASDLRTLEHRIGTLGAEAEKTGGFLDKLKLGAVMGLGAGAAQAGVSALAEGVKSAGLFAVETAANYERLKTALETTTGSAAAASAKFAELQEFARQTPFGLEETTEAFIKLSNRGLDASDTSLRALGDMASAMGKTLDDAVEMIADVTMGEGERAKEFGIVQEKMGDKVKITFRGMAKEVAFSAEEIQKHYLNIARANFSGGMEKQAKTLGGQWSALQDTFQQFAATLMDAGVSDALKEIMTDMSGMVSGGESLAKTLGGSLAEGLRATYNLAKAILPILEGTARAFNWVFSSADAVSDPIVEATARVQTLGRETEVATDRLVAYARAHGDALGPLGEMIKATFLAADAQESYNAAVRENIRAREDQARRDAAVATLTSRRAQEEASRLADLERRKVSAEKTAKMAEYNKLSADKSLTPSEKKRLRDLKKELDIEDTSAEDRARRAAAKRAAAQEKKDEKSAKSLAAKEFDFSADVDAFAFGQNADAHEEAMAAESQRRQARVTEIEREIEALEALGDAESEKVDAVFYMIEVEDEAARARSALIDQRIEEEERLARWEMKNAQTAEQREKARTRLEQAEHQKRLVGLQKSAAAEAKEHAKRQKVVETVTGAVTALGDGMVSAIERAAEGEKGAIASMLADLLKATATKHAVLALAEFALAAGSAAMYNFPAAAAHGVAGGLHTAVAVTAGAGAAAAGAVADARRGASARSGGGGPSPFGPTGGGGGRSEGGSTAGGSGNDEGLKAQSVPVSHEGLRRGDASMNRGDEGARVIISGTVNLYGPGGEQEFVDFVDRGLRRKARAGHRA